MDRRTPVPGDRRLAAGWYDGRAGAKPLLAPNDRMRLLHNVDLQLLYSLRVLVDERSVTRASERLGISQPTLSRMLAQLRDLARDPLLVRTARGMEPTSRAVELARGIEGALHGLESLFAAAQIFDPARETGCLSIATTEGRGSALLPHIARHAAESAPGIRLAHRPLDYGRVFSWLESGECDVAIGTLPNTPGGAYSIDLGHDNQCCIAAVDHPTIRDELTMSAYLEARHVVFRTGNDTATNGERSIDRVLMNLGAVRRVGLSLSSQLMSCHVVASTALIATVSEGMAQHAASQLPISVFPLPFEVPTLPISMVWHERTQHRPVCQWFRTLIREASERCVYGPARRMKGPVPPAGTRADGISRATRVAP